MPASSARQASRSASAVQTASLAAGCIFLLVGVLGFIPGVTANYGDLMIAGHDSNALLFGIFQVSILHNVIHLAFGLAAVACARAVKAARAFLIVAGVLYYVLSVYGLLLDPRSPANFLPLNTADNWLHIALTIGMLGTGTLLTRRRRTPSPATASASPSSAVTEDPVEP